MEELKRVILTHGSEILEYALMLLAYFLILLYRSKINHKSDNLGLLFKERTGDILKKSEELESIVSTNSAFMQNQLVEAQKKYTDAVNLIENLEQRLKRAEDALIEIIDELEVYDEEIYRETSDRDK